VDQVNGELTLGTALLIVGGCCLLVCGVDFVIVRVAAWRRRHGYTSRRVRRMLP